VEIRCADKQTTIATKAGIASKKAN
jgi:hypothetical protein